MDQPMRRAGGSWAERMLGPIERIGNRLPDPLTLFVLLAGVVVVASAVASGLGWTVTHPKTGEALHAVNLLTAEGVRRMFTDAVKNFTGFAPLGIVLVAMIGIGVTERGGLIKTVLKLIVGSVPRGMLSAAVIFAGMMSHLAADVGYVVVVPLGAVVFASVGRHPLAGLAAAFAGVSGGFSANLLISPIDSVLATMTQEGAGLLDPQYKVPVYANYYFMAVSTVLLTFIGWWVTEKVVEPRLGVWDAGQADDPLATADFTTIEAREKRAAWWALAAFLVVLAGVAALCLPEVGVLRDPKDGSFKPLQDSIITVIVLCFFVPGLVYGWVAGTIRDDKTVARMTAETMGTMGVYIVLAFAAAQFIEYFKWSNLGTMMAISGADALKSTGVGGLPLLLAIVGITIVLDLFIGSASAKWAIMAPVFVPMLLRMGVSPEATQASYRIGDSVANIISPLMPYFPVVIAFARKYDRTLGIGTLVASMLPYTLAFTLGWVGLLILWWVLKLPLGPGVMMTVIGG